MARHGSLRASDADREMTIERLRTAAAEGRLVAEELEQRVQVALTAQTYGELDATVADLPSARARSRREPAARSGREPARRHRPAGQWVVSTVARNPMLLLFAIPVVAVTFAMVLAATIMWAVLMVVALALGGHRQIGPPPLAFARRQAMRQVRRRAGSHWA